MRSIPRVGYPFAALLAMAIGTAVVWIGTPVGAQPQEQNSRQQLEALRAAALQGTGREPSDTVGAMSVTEFGVATDFFIPADYDGDGKNDHAVWSSGTIGMFKVLRSSDGVQVNTPFGTTGDLPKVVGDFDGDNKVDLALYRAGVSAGQYSTWFYFPSSGGALVTLTCSAAMDCGKTGDSVATGDVNNDGKDDFIVQRTHFGAACPTDNTQGTPAPFIPNADFLITLSGGATTTLTCIGKNTDVIAPGDYDGDGKIDIAVVRSSGGVWNWLIRRSSTLTFLLLQHGASTTDYITQGDYDGDGITDLAVWRPSAVVGASAFYIRPSTGGPTVQFRFGLNGDYPVANWNTH
jgi:hypothetical protein